MTRSNPATLAALKTLYETKRGKMLPLPIKLERLYGCLRMPVPRSYPHVFSNFVSTLDGVVSLTAKGHASGGIDLRLPIFTSGKVPVLIVTTTAGEKCLRRKNPPDSIEIRAIRRCMGAIPASAILDEVARVSAGMSILVEGGPRLLGEFYAVGLLDEQFLTLSPQIAGGDAGDRRLSLVMGQAFAPGDGLWGTLIDVRRGSSHLFLRYSFPPSRPGRKLSRRRSFVGASRIHGGS